MPFSEMTEGVEMKPEPVPAETATTVTVPPLWVQEQQTAARVAKPTREKDG